HAVSWDDVSGDEVKDDSVRQEAARQRTATLRRYTMRQHGERLGIDKTGRMVPQAVTSTRQDEDGDGLGSDAISPIRCGKTTASDFTEETKPLGQEGGSTASVRGEGQGSERRDQSPPPTETTGDADDPRVWRDKGQAESDSDGKTQDTGRLGLRQKRTMTARGVEALSPLTGAARRRSKTPTSTVQAARRRDDSVE
ncbi:hypothetical protein A4X13_0g8662, partial [Tilletia indica]